VNTWGVSQLRKEVRLSKSANSPTGYLGGVSVHTTREIIRNAEALPTLGSSAIQRVKRYGTTSQVAEGEILIKQGKPLDHFIVVLEGEAVVELTNQIGTELIATHGPGEFFGDINMLSGIHPFEICSKVGNHDRTLVHT